MKTLIAIIITLAFAVLCYYAGMNHPITPTGVGGHILPIEEVIREVPVEVIREVYVTVETEIIKEVPVYEANKWAREFESVGQFEDWYWEQGFTLLMPSSTYEVDCDDYAYQVQRAAVQQGYMLSVALVEHGRFYSVKVTNIPGGHMGNLVIINGIIYYVEPKPDEFDVVKIVSVD